MRCASGEPFAHEIAYLAGPLPRLRAELEQRGSLYLTLREVYGIELVSVEDVVETALADPVEASLLGVDTGLPMFAGASDGPGRIRPAGRVDALGVPRRPLPVRRQEPAGRPSRRQPSRRRTVT
ncbi:MAG TPA: UTRA domain-containing protein [Nakamurella sp.]